MATYSATNYLTKPDGNHGLGGNAKAYYFEVACSSAPTTSDTINFGYVPKGFRLLFATLESTDMDTGGSPTLALNVGDSGDADRIFAASTVGQAGTLSTALAVTGGAYVYTDRTLITGVPSANPATGAAGTLYLSLVGILEDSATS